MKVPDQIKRTKSFDCPTSCSDETGCTFTVVVSWVQEDANPGILVRDLIVKLSAKGSNKCNPLFSLTSRGNTCELTCTPDADPEHPIKVDEKALGDAQKTDHQAMPNPQIPDVRPSFTLDYWDPKTLAPELTRRTGQPYLFTFSPWVVLRAFTLKASLRCRCICADANRDNPKQGEFQDETLKIEAEAK
jgi:hypothetical protein